MNILIKGVYLDGMARDIFLEDGKITEISGVCERQADRTIDGTDKVALPALINGHTHAAMTLLRGYADDMPLQKWLEEKIWVLEAKLTEEDVYWGAKLACLEMIKGGITAFNDMYWFWESTARAVSEMGLRGVLSGVFIDMFDVKKTEEQIHRNIELFRIAEKYKPDVTFALGPHAVYSVSRESLNWIKEFSEENDLLVHMHLSETEGETRFTLEKYGVSPTRFLDDLGLLSDRFVGAHGCWLTEEDIAILAKNKANLVTNPVSNLKLSVGKIFPYRSVRQNDVPFCLGTDGCSSNNHLDLVETMKFAALLAKFSANDPAFLPAKEVFDLGTKTAAAIFFRSDWDIKVGSSPDIILVDTRRPEFVPNFNIYSDMVYAANGYAVDSVICMGKILMERRRVEGEEEIMEKARRVARKLAER